MNFNFSILKKFTIFACILFFCFQSSADIYKESANVHYKKFKGNAKQEVIEQAMFEACSKAILKYA